VDEKLGVADRVAVGVPVSVKVLVSDWVGLAVRVAVGVAVSVMVRDGVTEGVPVRVRVGVEAAQTLLVVVVTLLGVPLTAPWKNTSAVLTMVQAVVSNQGMVSE
jgi:hypothetical protein